MKSLLGIALAIFLTACSAAPIDRTVEAQTKGLGSALNAWARDHGFVDWSLTIDALSAPREPQWSVQVSFVVPNSVDKARVDEAELEFYRWFKTQTPGLEVEAKFVRVEKARATVPGAEPPSWFQESYGAYDPDFPPPMVSWMPKTVDGKPVFSAVATWTWPADLPPALEAEGSRKREKQRAETGAKWSKVPSVSANDDMDRAWSAVPQGGRDLADTLNEARGAMNAVAKARWDNVPNYSVRAAREGAEAGWQAERSPWFPDAIHQTIAFRVNVLAPGGPLAWNDWQDIRRRLGGGPIEASYQFDLSVDLTKAANQNAWRDQLHAELGSLLGDWSRSWSTTGPTDGAPPIEEIAITAPTFDAEHLAELAALHARYQK